MGPAHPRPQHPRDLNGATSPGDRPVSTESRATRATDATGSRAARDAPAAAACHTGRAMSHDPSTPNDPNPHLTPPRMGRGLVAAVVLPLVLPLLALVWFFGGPGLAAAVTVIGGSFVLLAIYVPGVLEALLLVLSVFSCVAGP